MGAREVNVEALSMAGWNAQAQGCSTSGATQQLAGVFEFWRLLIRGRPSTPSQFTVYLKPERCNSLQGLGAALDKLKTLERVMVTPSGRRLLTASPSGTHAPERRQAHGHAGVPEALH